MQTPRLSPVEVKFQLWSRIFAYTVFIIGATALIGWQFDLDTLKRPLPNLVSMNPATAVCFVLSALAFLFLTNDQKPKWQYFAGYSAAMLILVISILKIGGLLLALDVNIDTWLFYEKIEADVINNVKNRMAPNTALAFFFTGFSLLMINHKSRGTYQLITLLVGLLALLSILGYLYQVKSFYGFLKYIPMAVNTAVGFLLTSLAVLFYKPNRGFMSEFVTGQAGAIISRTLIPTALLVPTILGFLSLYLNANQVITSRFGIALLVLGNILIFLILIWFNAKELNTKDRQRNNAKNQLYQANKELESFSYSVAHDLRAPLRSVKSYAEIFVEDHGDKLDGDAASIMDTIQRNANKMGVLIDDLLAFSRLGRQEINKIEVDMNELTEEIITEFSKSYKHHAEININDLHEIKGDRALLYQVMSNLISNAVKYSSKKEKPVIDIKSLENGSQIIYSVKDNGAGFDMQYADKLFGVFQRLHSQNEFEGTGIGLAIINRIVNKHGGKVWAEAEVDKGATFFYTLPKEA